ncbi:hypothetical protein GMOD_00000072 [Pyrenophora seminiperda CCB06]|uniref:Uncharacterized protein n=1 Tax=Pyrenophora seminiperda CCB06 TaxID=1302712 RepID=A0A3M7M6B5_9PLEO|nr:hypothetical protein GMOD_00000072 [Pyrenophora seminiperda CCB06]
MVELLLAVARRNLPPPVAVVVVQDIPKLAVARQDFAPLAPVVVVQQIAAVRRDLLPPEPVSAVQHIPRLAVARRDFAPLAPVVVVQQTAVARLDLLLLALVVSVQQEQPVAFFGLPSLPQFLLPPVSASHAPIEELAVFVHFEQPGLPVEQLLPLLLLAFAFLAALGFLVALSLFSPYLPFSAPSVAALALVSLMLALIAVSPFSIDDSPPHLLPFLAPGLDRLPHIQTHRQIQKKLVPLPIVPLPVGKKQGPVGHQYLAFEHYHYIRVVGSVWEVAFARAFWLEALLLADAHFVLAGCLSTDSGLFIDDTLTLAVILTTVFTTDAFDFVVTSIRCVAIIAESYVVLLIARYTGEVWRMCAMLARIVNIGNLETFAGH